VEDPTTQELRLEQLRREASEREAASGGTTPDDTEQHERRADKAEYLREKLEQRAQSERAEDDTDDVDED
jgi:hypothetical protein